MTPDAILRREKAADLKERRARGEVIKRGRRSKVDIENSARLAAEAAADTAVGLTNAEIAKKTDAKATKPAPSYTQRPLTTAPAEPALPSRPTIPSGLRPKSAEEPDAPVVATPAPPTPKLSARASIRRLRGLVALGYAASEVAKEVGITTDQTWHLLITAPDQLKPTTIESIAAAYKKLAQRPPMSPEGTPQFASQQANRDLGRSLGWPTFFLNFDMDSDEGLQPIGAVGAPATEQSSETAPAPVRPATDEEASRAVAKAKASAERLKGQLHDAEIARNADKAAADEKIAGLEAQLDEAAREISRLKTVEIDQNQLIGQQGADLSRLRLDREDAIEKVGAENVKLRREVELLRMTGHDVVLTLGSVPVPGILVDFDIEASTASLAILGAEGKPPQVFDLNTWDIARAAEPLAIGATHLSLVSA
ncbi:hypothetical protein GCM10025867_49610 (plasmid) [Frondihabitans sucicola]|uniref:Uncharacterized protein n=1 Tax=Frondihabitans sucicola TaxID=1268041 RepID=A0ABN6Y5W1_9MICO|nr:hypothetical protein [Frondihabitans sucicola]BDZ52720.1 hypothetical protein GCM10025867_49610 [Frondihabitans sucicola]